MAVQYTENLIPIMTSNTTPSGECKASSVYNVSYVIYKAFNGNMKEGWCAVSNTNQWIQYKFKEETVINKYAIYNVFANVDALSWCPHSWTLKGSNDEINWVVLDVQENQIWTKDEGKEFVINNNNKYLYYKLDSLSCSGGKVFIGEIEMFGLAKLKKFLLKQSNQYYTLKSEFYSNGNFTPIMLENGLNPNDNDWKTYGFDDLSLLMQDITIGTETFKPIDKLKLIGDGKFDIVMKQLEES